MALRLGAVQPARSANPTLHFQLHLRPGAPAAAPAGGRAPASPIELVASDGQELITWLLGLQAVVVPARPAERLSLWRIARRRARMIVRFGAIRQGISFRQNWASIILNAAATYDRSRDAAADRWQQSREGLSEELRRASFRDALGGAAAPPTTAPGSAGRGRASASGASAPYASAAGASGPDAPQGASYERFSAAARRAEERRSSAGGTASPLDRGGRHASSAQRGSRTPDERR